MHSFTCDVCESSHVSPTAFEVESDFHRSTGYAMQCEPTDQAVGEQRTFKRVLRFAVDAAIRG